LQLGDSLLMIGSRSHLERLRSNPDFIVLEPSLSDQPVQRTQAALTVGVFAAAITASILGFPVYLAMLAGVVILILARVLDMDEAYRSVNWQAIILIAGMYVVSLAMVNTGLAQAIGEQILTLTRPVGALGLAGGAFLLSVLLTQVMGGGHRSGHWPVTISAAISLSSNPQAIAWLPPLAAYVILHAIAHPVNT
jgi:di/tricarboxylate transporter